MNPGLIQPISHTPDIAPLEIEDSPEDLLPDELDLSGTFIEGNVLVVDGRPYPIGESFYGADGIPLGPMKTDRTGLYGYALIQNAPDHVLLWYLDGTGRLRNLIVPADDPLLVGELGFFEKIENLRDAENRFAATIGTGASGLITAAIVQYAVCPATGGTTCVTGTATLAVGSAIALVGGGLGIFLFDVIPDIVEVERAFSILDANRP